MKEKLLKHLQANHGWHKKVDLFYQFYGTSPETIGRYLRELAEEKEIKVDYYDGEKAKGLAKYCYQEKKPQQQAFFNIPVAL